MRRCNTCGKEIEVETKIAYFSFADSTGTPAGKGGNPPEEVARETWKKLFKS